MNTILWSKDKQPWEWAPLQPLHPRVEHDWLWTLLSRLLDFLLKGDCHGNN